MTTQSVMEVGTKPIPGPVAGTRITEAYARTVMRDAFFWAWPLINVYAGHRTDRGPREGWRLIRLG